jgi:hypothetical protein
VTGETAFDYEGMDSTGDEHGSLREMRNGWEVLRQQTEVLNEAQEE